MDGARLTMLTCAIVAMFHASRPRVALASDVPKAAATGGSSIDSFNPPSRSLMDSYTCMQMGTSMQQVNYLGASWIGGLRCVQINEGGLPLPGTTDILQTN